MHGVFRVLRHLAHMPQRFGKRWNAQDGEMAKMSASRTAGVPPTPI
jgi:hypothetical protein